MKKVMILGAGIYQVPLIEEAKKAGIYTIVVSYKGNYPGFRLADKCYELDTTDAGSVLEAARREQIDGICTSGTDVAVRTLGFVCQELHLCGLPYTAAVTVTDKYLMKEALSANNVSCAKYAKADSLEEALRAFHAMKMPGAASVMIKAVDSSGSRGITKVTAEKEVAPAYAEACRVTRRPYILVEEFIEGHEIGVDGFISNGKIVLLLPHEKLILKTGGTTIPAGHSFPFKCSGKLHDEICHQIELAIHATGLDNCAFNADVIVNGDHAWILEIGGRAGATGIPELISIYCGFSYYEAILKNALGETPDFSVCRQTPCMSQVLFSRANGTITNIDHEMLTQLKKDGIAVSLDYKIGDTVSAVHNGTDRIGQFIMESVSAEKTAETLQRICSSIYIDHRPLPIPTEG